MDGRKIFFAGQSLALIAHRVHEHFTAYSDADRAYLVNRCEQRTGIVVDVEKLLDKRASLAEVERALEIGFGAWRKSAFPEGCRLYYEGRLSPSGQLKVIDHLPIAPADFGNREFIDAVCSCADYYYRWQWKDVLRWPTEKISFWRGRYEVYRRSRIIARMGAEG